MVRDNVPTERGVRVTSGAATGLTPLRSVGGRHELWALAASRPQSAVWNVATHTRKELTEQEGMEQIGAYGHLARLLDSCTVVRHGDDSATNV